MENRISQIRAILTAQLDRPLTESPSPFMCWLAPVVREVGEEGLTFDYTIRPEMANPMGTLHGGITAGIMDDLIGATVICMGRQYFYTTVNNTIDYLATAKVGETVTGKTTIVRAGRQIINIQFELWYLPKKRLLARGNSNMLKTDIPMPESGIAST
ncbi:PaaI family thioesterase [Mucilaginibacter polytrichastri]|nr:PaaI family thioesterase [Mucilaginibacter polytrichastri]SFS82078.1 uncharacterized domain 1-containing protein [Mucilaginibacter polytrichastri]